MTPKEKAKNLVDNCYQLFPLQSEIIIYNKELYLEYDEWGQAKEAALIAVDELIENVKSVDSRPPNYQTINEGTKEYWKQVRNEIEKL